MKMNSWEINSLQRVSPNIIIAGIEDNMAQKLSAMTLLASITYTLLENEKGRVNIKNKTVFSSLSLPSYFLISKGAI